MNLWNRFRDGLKKTREQVAEGLGQLLRQRGTVDAATRERLEETLIAADVGPDNVQLLTGRGYRVYQRPVSSVDVMTLNTTLPGSP